MSQSQLEILIKAILDEASKKNLSKEAQEAVNKTKLEFKADLSNLDGFKKAIEDILHLWRTGKVDAGTMLEISEKLYANEKFTSIEKKLQVDLYKTIAQVQTAIEKSSIEINSIEKQITQEEEKRKLLEDRTAKEREENELK